MPCPVSTQRGARLGVTRPWDETEIGQKKGRTRTRNGPNVDAWLPRLLACLVLLPGATDVGLATAVVCGVLSVGGWLLSLSSSPRLGQTRIRLPPSHRSSASNTLLPRTRTQGRPSRAPTAATRSTMVALASPVPPPPPTSHCGPVAFLASLAYAQRSPVRFE